MRRLSTAVIALILVGSSLAVAGASQATETSKHPVEIDLHRNFSGSDTYMFSIRSTTDFNIANGSFFKVKGWYVTPNGTGSARQHASGLRGVISYINGTTCFSPEQNRDPCFMGHAGLSKGDVSEARVTVGNFTFKSDPNWRAWGSANGSIRWDTATKFEKPAGADQVTIRFLLSIPGAERLDVDVHIHSPHNISIRNWTAHDGGKTWTTEDFDPTARAETTPVEAAVDATHVVNFDPAKRERFYGSFGPSWVGETQTVGLRGQHNTAAVSRLFYTHPNGNTHGGTGVAVVGAPELHVQGEDMPGPYRFEIEQHAGAGPQDVYLVTTRGPIP